MAWPLASYSSDGHWLAVGGVDAVCLLDVFDGFSLVRTLRAGTELCHQPAAIKALNGRDSTERSVGHVWGTVFVCSGSVSLWTGRTTLFYASTHTYYYMITLSHAGTHTKRTRTRDTAAQYERACHLRPAADILQQQGVSAIRADGLRA